MNHIAVQLMGITVFMMINSSRQMDKEGQVSRKRLSKDTYYNELNPGKIRVDLLARTDINHPGIVAASTPNSDMMATVFIHPSL